MAERPPTTRHPAPPRELLEEFASADLDHDGRVNYDELRQLLLGLDAGMSEAQMRLGFREVATDHDSMIERSEFAEWWSAD